MEIIFWTITLSLIPLIAIIVIQREEDKKNRIHSINEESFKAVNNNDKNNSVNNDKNNLVNKDRNKSVNNDKNNSLRPFLQENFQILSLILLLLILISSINQSKFIVKSVNEVDHSLSLIGLELVDIESKLNKISRHYE